MHTKWIMGNRENHIRLNMNLRFAAVIFSMTIGTVCISNRDQEYIKTTHFLPHLQYWIGKWEQNMSPQLTDVGLLGSTIITGAILSSITYHSSHERFQIPLLLTAILFCAVVSVIARPPIDLLLLGGAPWVLAAALAGSRMFPGTRDA
ncbi:hypothetical protein BGZ57DRAFT_913875 [Hyaloscypha finlandica]|nr:hypothetical protein BGZ57DRAFT_913875 [Hyaloscypha finlandica]